MTTWISYVWWALGHNQCHHHRLAAAHNTQPNDSQI